MTELTMPEWVKNGVVYEVNWRLYTEEGTINSFLPHLRRLKEMGVNILWFMPVFSISEKKRKGSLGSYYSVKDYRSLNPEFGTKDEFKLLIESIHALEMKIILDWVPNHTGWDHEWINSNPQFYQKDKDGNITDPLDWNGNPQGWEDVAGLHYGSSELRTKMIEELNYWLHEFNIDGYRMDIAWGVPLDFWKECATALRKSKPDIFLLAEADTPAFLNENAFHSGYGWKLHHIMNEIAKGHLKAWDIDKWLYEEKTKFVSGALLQFITNHDENSWSGSEIERMGEAYKAFAVLIHTLDGIPLIYSGQEEPLEKRLLFFEKDNIGFKNYSLKEFYRKLCLLRKDQAALWCNDNGLNVVKIADSADVYAFMRSLDQSQVAVILNLCNQSQSITLKTNLTNFIEVFSEKTVNLNAGEVINLQPWEYLVFKKLNP